MDFTDSPDDSISQDEEPPDFTEWGSPDAVLHGGATRERLLDVVIQVRTPTKVSVLAERAACDTETAREYLKWFAELGIVHEIPGRPVQYERNESYLRWRRVERIRETYTDEELVAELAQIVDELAAFRERFDADSPADVSLIEDSHDQSIENTWEALTEWQTLERRAELLDAARRSSNGANDTSRVDV